MILKNSKFALKLKTEQIFLLNAGANYSSVKYFGNHLISLALNVNLNFADAKQLISMVRAPKYRFLDFEIQKPI